MSLDHFFNKFTDPNNIDNILCDKQILIDFIKSNTTKKTPSKTPSKIRKIPNTFIMWKNDNMNLIKSYFNDYNTTTDWSRESKIRYYKNKEIGIPKKDGKPKLVELITIKAGIIWKNIDQDIKNKYELKRDNTIKEFNSSRLKHNTKVKDTWIGPYYNKEISKKVKKDGKIFPVYKKHTLDQIIHIADTMGNLCGGITETSNGKYSLRFGELIDKPNVCSWLKKDYVYTKTKRGRPKKQPTYVSDSESDNELLDSPNIVVTLVTYNGKQYYHNEETHDIYEPNSGDIVGEWVKKKKKGGVFERMIGGEMEDTSRFYYTIQLF